MLISSLSELRVWGLFLNGRPQERSGLAQVPSGTWVRAAASVLCFALESKLSKQRRSCLAVKQPRTLEKSSLGEPCRAGCQKYHHWDVYGGIKACGSSPPLPPPSLLRAPFCSCSYDVLGSPLTAGEHGAASHDSAVTGEEEHHERQAEAGAKLPAEAPVLGG